jgi:DNA (cytosine-5)-methyltransferase 1
MQAIGQYALDGTASTLKACDHKEPKDLVIPEALAFHPTQDPISSVGVSHCLGARPFATSAIATYSTPAIGHIKADHIASTLTRNTGGGGSGGPAGNECQNLVAAPIPFVKAKRAQSAEDDETWEADRPAPTLSVFDSGDTRATVAVVTPPPLTVRRLTPMECERLQGFPDGWTAIPYRGKPAADGPRYKAIGNSMAVPVMRWIGERIKAYEEEP